MKAHLKKRWATCGHNSTHSLTQLYDRDQAVLEFLAGFLPFTLATGTTSIPQQPQTTSFLTLG